jgi:hypothetical protein
MVRLEVPLPPFCSFLRVYADDFLSLSLVSRSLTVMVSALLNESSNASFIEIIPYFIILYLNIASTPIKHKRGRLTPHLLSLAQR